RDDVEELLAGVGDAAASAGKREGWPNDRRQADGGQRFQRLDQAALDVALLALGIARSPGPVESEQRLGFLRLRQLLVLDGGDLGRMLLAVGLFQRRGVG